MRLANPSHGTIAAIGTALLLAASPAGARPPETFHGPPGVTGLLHAGVAGGATAAVLIVHDAPGLDGRSGGYVAQLRAAGLLVLEIELAANAPDGLAAPLPAPDAAGRLVAAAAAMLAGDPRADPARIGALGFGFGARAVAFAEGAPFAARLLLYPGCAGLAARPAAGPVLILHGEADLANAPAACAGLADRLGAGASRVAYAGAGYAWDLPQSGGSPCTAQPAPDRPGSLGACAWPELAELSAAQAAAFLHRALHGPSLVSAVAAHGRQRSSPP